MQWIEQWRVCDISLCGEFYAEDWDIKVEKLLWKKVLQMKPVSSVIEHFFRSIWDFFFCLENIPERASSGVVSAVAQGFGFLQWKPASSSHLNLTPKCQTVPLSSVFRRKAVKCLKKTNKKNNSNLWIYLRSIQYCQARDCITNVAEDKVQVPRFHSDFFFFYTFISMVWKMQVKLV